MDDRFESAVKPDSLEKTNRLIGMTYSALLDLRLRQELAALEGDLVALDALCLAILPLDARLAALLKLKMRLNETHPELAGEVAR